ncbi:MAG: hypothetical protein LBI09_03550, partial [Nitrososphaerota archaeon]|nr:hypothetical protein [Nitrososphaerota archaeon]
MVFSLSVGVFTSNATGQQTLTAENVSINITTGSNTYLQGDMVSFKMISNTTPTGNLYLYDPTGEIF